MASNYPELTFSADEAFDEKRLNAAMKVLDARLRALEPFSPSWAAAIAELQAFGLKRLDDALRPIYEQVTAISQVGVMFSAASASELTVGLGTLTLVLEEEDRARFAAAAYIGVMKNGDASVQMSGRLVSYIRETGALVIDVDHAAGVGTFADWRVSASVDGTIFQAVVDDLVAEVHAALTVISDASNLTSGILPAKRLPAPTETSLGGVVSSSAPAKKFAVGIDDAGAMVFKQPAFSDVSGKASADQLPAASATALGGVKVGSGLSVDGSGLLRSQTGFEALAYENIAVNPRHVISQRNGSNAVSQGYVTDGWAVTCSGPVISAQQVSSPFPSRPDLLKGLQVTVATAAPSLSAGNYFTITQPVEGVRCRRLMFGKVSASPVLIAFTCRSNVSINGALAVRNVSGNRSYVSPFTVAANADTLVSFVIPGDIAGTWPTDNTASMSVGITLATASTFQTTNQNSWQAGNFIGLPLTSNFSAAVGNTFTISDLIIVPVPDASIPASAYLPTDRLPFFERHYDDELRLCQRYYWQPNITVISFGCATAVGNQAFSYMPAPVPMRAAPTAVYSWSGLNNATGIAPNMLADLRTVLINTVALGRVDEFERGGNLGISQLNQA